MKQVQLIETGIIIIILILSYQFIDSLIQLIITLFFQLSSGMPGQNNLIKLVLIFPFVLYLSVIYLLIRYKNPLIRLLTAKEKDEHSLAINFSGRQLLQTTIVILCFVTLINEMPVAISILIESLKTESTYNEVGGDRLIYDPILTSSFLSPVIKVLLAILILSLSKYISKLLSNNADTPENLRKD